MYEIKMNKNNLETVDLDVSHSFEAKDSLHHHRA